MWEGNKTDLTEAKFDRRNIPGYVREKTLLEYRHAARNCTQYRQLGGFEAASVSPEELSFPLAFSLVVHKDADQVEDLLGAIYRPHNVYCVHVDGKSDRQFWNKLHLVVSCLPNVFLSKVHVNVAWGDFTSLEPDILCMRQLWTHQVRWKYFINLRGQDFPLKTNKELVRIVRAFRGANDISGDPTGSEGPWRQFLPTPYNVTLYKGSVHIVASRDYVDYVLHSHVGQALLQWVKPTGHPDESFFNTLNHNPQLGVPGSVSSHMVYKASDSFARYEVRRGDNPHPCGGTFVRGICHFGIEDLPRLVSSPKLFAGKFTFNFQPLARHCVMEWYRYKVSLEETGKSMSLDVDLYERSTLVKNRYTGPVKIW